MPKVKQTKPAIPKLTAAELRKLQKIFEHWLEMPIPSKEELRALGKTEFYTFARAEQLNKALTSVGWGDVMDWAIYRCEDCDSGFMPAFQDRQSTPPYYCRFCGCEMALSNKPRPKTLAEVKA